MENPHSGPLSGASVSVLAAAVALKLKFDTIK